MDGQVRDELCELLATSAHAERYFNPPGNHPSQPNYLWLEAGTNFGVLADTQPGQPQLDTTKHLVALLENAEFNDTPPNDAQILSLTIQAQVLTNLAQQFAATS